LSEAKAAAGPDLEHAPGEAGEELLSPIGDALGLSARGLAGVEAGVEGVSVAQSARGLVPGRPGSGKSGAMAGGRSAGSGYLGKRSWSTIITNVVNMSSDRLKPVEAGSTRERILAGAMQLFAARGYDGTSVGDIEKAAGLAPRSGALYQHFDSKRQVLELAIERQLASLSELGSALDMLPLGDLRAELTLMARWNLVSLDARRPLATFLRREGDRLPPELREKLYRRLVAEPYAQVVGWLRGRIEAAGADEPDLDALALILIEPMSSFRSMQWLFEKTPGEVDDRRFVETWVDVCLAYAQSIGLK
jgi:AcrR family transcriptional regulator